MEQLELPFIHTETKLLSEWEELQKAIDEQRDLLIKIIIDCGVQRGWSTDFYEEKYKRIKVLK